MSKQVDEQLPPYLLNRVHYLELYTSRVVRSALMGDHKSRVRGHGFDFDEHKKYQQGDDYRQIDWNVFARLEEVFVKKNLEDKELNVVLVADISGSMDLSTHDVSKKELLLEIAAILAFSAAVDQIGVGLLAFTDRVEDYLSPAKGRRQAWKILERLWSLTPQGAHTDLHSPLEFLNTHLKKCTLIFYLSDFMGKGDLFYSPYLKMLVRRHDLVPVVIEDKLETVLPATRGFLRIRDLESGKEMIVRTSPENQKNYQRQLDERRSNLRSSFYRLGLDHLWLRSDRPYINPLLHFFLSRKRRR